MFLLASLLLVCPQSASNAVGPLDDPRAPFGYDLELGAGEALIRYRWDDGRPVPAFSTELRQRIPFGERGMEPATRVYLPANSPFDANATGATVLVQDGVGFVDARLGPALEFAADSLLRVSLPPADPQVNGWTLSFRVRPDGASLGRTFLRLPGALELALLADGRLRATLSSGGGVLVNPAFITAGEWSHVTVAYDPEHLRQLRIVVDQDANILRFSSPAPARLAGELWVGDVDGTSSGLVGLVDELVLEPHPLSTAQALASQRVGPEPGNHTLEITTNLGARTVTVAAGATRKSVLETAGDFAQGDLNGTVTRLGVLHWAPGRWKQLRTQGAPAPRTTHPVVSLGGGRMFTFSGETRDSFLWPMINTVDTWIFDGATNDWTEIRTAVAPSGRCHAPAAYSPDHDVVLYVGGWQNDSTPGAVHSDTWVYHVGQKRWEQRFPTGDSLGQSSDHGLVYLPDRQQFLLLRGDRNWIYDPAADHWTLLPRSSAVMVDGTPTTYGLGASTACERDPATGKIVLFGGSYGPSSNVFSDVTAVYDVDTNVYTVLDPIARPSPRVRGAFAHDPARGLFVYFGGVQDQFSQRHGDLWVFELATLEWKAVACSDRPSPRGGYYGMGWDGTQDRFVLYGGRSTPTLWLDETWTLELDFARPGTALYTFDRLNWRERRTWFSEEVLPGDAAVAYRFRGGNDGSTWGPWEGPGFDPGGARFVQVEVELTPGSRRQVPFVRRMGWR